MSGARLVLIAIIVVLLVPAAWGEENSCVACHSDPKVIQSLPSQQTYYFAEWSASIHAANGITCDKCMGGDATKREKDLAHAALRNASDPGSPIYYKNIPETCGRCHQAQYTNFTQSLHYQRLKAEKLGPECVTCHGSVGVQKVDPLKISMKCASICHNEIMGIKPNKPAEAREILTRAEEVKAKILQAQAMVGVGEKGGVDMTKAEEALKEASIQLKHSTGTWHRFDLDAFQNEVKGAADLADLGFNLARDTLLQEKKEDTTVYKVAIALLVIILLAAVFVLRKK